MVKNIYVFKQTIRKLPIKKNQMIQLLSKIENGIGTINEVLGRAASWLTFVLVLLVCYDVTVRYLFKDTQTWIIELEWHLFALIFLLGAGYTLKHDHHVRVDLFYTNFSKRDKAWVNLSGAILFLIPWCIVIMIYSFAYANNSFQIGEGSPDPGGLPARYVIKYAMTVGVGFLLLQAIASVCNSVITILETNNENEVTN